VTFFPLVAFVRYFVYNKPKSNLCSAITTLNTAEKAVLSHTHKTQLHFSRMYFYPEYSGYRSQTREGWLSPAQTTARSTANSSVSMSTLLRSSRIPYGYTLQYRCCSSITTVRITRNTINPLYSDFLSTNPRITDLNYSYPEPLLNSDSLFFVCKI